MRACVAIVVAVFLAAPTAGAAKIGFVDPSARPGLEGADGFGPRNAAAFAFAATQGEAARLAPQQAGGWLGTDGRIQAPEEFDLVWFHQGDDPATTRLSPEEQADLNGYLEGGGSLLLTGAAGVLLNELGIEETPLRVLSTTDAAYLSGIVVPEERRSHPIFTGLDATRPILLTSLGGNALADFYGTGGPHGELLAEGNAGLGERPLVEYRVGKGHVVFVGWRLPDFTTAEDEYRPNLERLFGNIIAYLAQACTSRGTLARPAGNATYARVLGVPFLRADQPEDLEVPAAGGACAVTLSNQAAPDGDHEVGGLHVSEQAVAGDTVIARSVLALTLTSRERPVATFVEAREVERQADERADRELIGNLQVIAPTVRFGTGPVQPLNMVEPEQSVLLGRSPFMAPGDGRGDITPEYEPVEDGGFRISGSRKTLNRPIVQGQNRVITGDAPLFKMDTLTGQGCYSADRIFPLWPRPEAAAGGASVSLGTLRLGVADGDTVRWLDELAGVTTTFRPGYTEYSVSGPAAEWTAQIVAAPAPTGNGMLCRVEFDRDVRLVWRFGGVWWQPQEDNANKVDLTGGRVAITEPNLPNGVSLAAWDGHGDGRIEEQPYGQEAVFTASEAQSVYHVSATWGVTTYDEARARATMDRLDTWATAGWAPVSRDKLKREWFDCYVGGALHPEARLDELAADPEPALRAVRDRWDARRAEFQVRTPDPQLNALANWVRCLSEYHRMGPGLVLGAFYWQMYSHISTGWYGKQWGGDHDALADCLRLYGAMQSDDGSVRWVSPSLAAFDAENNTPYWVDQVWWHYAWTGDLEFLRELWPSVRKAVECQRKRNDPDDDGLFRDWYEYWNCDSNGKGPKAAASSAMSWAMLDRAARIADVLGEDDAASQYRALADRTRERIMAELWREDKGRLGSIGADGIWRGHPQTWEEYLAINAGLLSPDQGRQAMRWLAARYGFEPQPGVHLLACSDWYPIRWSNQWVPTGDTCLAALAGMRCGDQDLWWPYLKTVVGSAFKSEFPGVNMGISNAGAGGGDREDVDSEDPHIHAIVRGLFGIEPAVHEGRIDIQPAFPSDWADASIVTPDISYEYRREGDTATFTVHTSRPLVKRIRPNLTGREVETPAETDSVVVAPVGPTLEPPGEPEPRPVLRDITGGEVDAEAASPGAPITDDQAARLVLFDLGGSSNQPAEALGDTAFVFDYSDSPQPVASWWGNPRITLGPSPRALRTPGGVVFLTAGRPRPGLGDPLNNLLMLSSWAPQPVPATATLDLGLRCERLWLLLASYVHPMKNYVPNGEVVLRYDDGTEDVTSLVPPYNLDCWFQHFSLEGAPVAWGRIDWGGGTFVHTGLSRAHADALPIACDPAKTLLSVEIRATCSEGVLGVLGMTALRPEQ